MTLSYRADSNANLDRQKEIRYLPTTEQMLCELELIIRGILATVVVSTLFRPACYLEETGGDSYWSSYLNNAMDLPESRV